MHTINIGSCGQEITINFNEASLKKAMLDSDFIKKYIPSPTISRTKNLNNPKINVTRSPQFGLTGKYPSFNYQGDNFQDILFLSEFILERERQEKGMYSIHSSCAEKNGKGVLLFGWKDTGKTSVALHLAKEKGYNFLSEGRTVICQKNKIVGKIHHLEEDNDFLKEKYGFTTSCLDISQICPISNNDSKLNLIVYPQITGFPLELREWDKDKTNYHLYECFSDVIRGVAKNINNYTCPLQSLDTKKIAYERSKFINKLAENNKVLQIRGSLENICETIDKLNH